MFKYPTFNHAVNISEYTASNGEMDDEVWIRTYEETNLYDTWNYSRAFRNLKMTVTTGNNYPVTRHHIPEQKPHPFV